MNEQIEISLLHEVAETLREAAEKKNMNAGKLAKIIITEWVLQYLLEN